MDLIILKSSSQLASLIRKKLKGLQSCWFRTLLMAFIIVTCFWYDWIREGWNGFEKDFVLEENLDFLSNSHFEVGIDRRDQFKRGRL